MGFRAQELVPRAEDLGPRTWEGRIWAYGSGVGGVITKITRVLGVYGVGLGFKV